MTVEKDNVKIIGPVEDAVPNANVSIETSIPSIRFLSLILSPVHTLISGSLLWVGSQ